MAEANPEMKSSSDLIDPQERLKHLINYCNAVEVDYHIPPMRYYRSGLEMVRMATVYQSEGNLENAYVLYLKFMTLFLEKIRKHPDFSNVPAKIKAINQAKLREILPKAEKLKEQLLKQYQDEYTNYLAAKEKKKSKKAPSRPDSYNLKFDSSIELPQMPPSVDGISYPDFNSTAAPSIQKDLPTIPSAPSFDRTTKPTDGYTGNYSSDGLRQVIIPSRVMTQFQTMAQRNTVSNIETCGILAGRLAKNELIISHMILPKQKGTADSCMTMNEEEIFDFQDQHNLITIGWIHTHPTQTAFLSSVDLHTHCPYQLLMPEAIAIVCAPRYNETGFFVLTPDYGLKFISNCRKSGFHPHPTEPPLFMVAQHVKIDQNASLDVLDLRI